MYPDFITNKKNIYKYFLKYFGGYGKREIFWEINYLYKDDNLSYNKRKKAFMEKYGLDRFADNGDDLLICLKVMEWTFQILLFEKLDDYSGIMSSRNIIEYSRKEKKGVNCLCHSIVLAETLNYLGYKSKRVSCLPMDVIYSDNHVIVNTYIPSLSKWVMLDPSMCCYIEDTNHVVLSVEEIRNNLINGNKLYPKVYSRFSLGKDHQSSKYQFDSIKYLSYLYKNFFRFVVRENQGDYPTKKGDIYYMLIPSKYYFAIDNYISYFDGEEVEIRVTTDNYEFWK